MGTGGGPTNPDGDANPFGNPGEDQTAPIPLNLTVGQVNNEQHGTATERAENNRAVGAEETIVFRFRANNNLPPNGLPLTLSTANEGTQIPTQITVFTVDENGNEEAVDGGDSGEGNTVLANSDRSIINLVFNDNQDYNIKVKNLSEDTAGTVQLNVNWTKQLSETTESGNPLRFSPQVYTLDGTHTWTNSMITETQNALDLWSNTITDMPEGGGSDRLLDISLALANLPVDPSFGSTTVIATDNANNFEGTNNLFNRYPTSARILVNLGPGDILYEDWLDNDADTTHALQDIVVRQTGQALGIGGEFWRRNQDPNQNLHKEALFATNPNAGLGIDAKLWLNTFNTVVIPQFAPDPIIDNNLYLLYQGANVLQIYQSFNNAGATFVDPENTEDTNYIFSENNFNTAYNAATGANVVAADFLGVPIINTTTPLHPFEGAAVNVEGEPAAGFPRGEDGSQTGFVRFDDEFGGQIPHLGLGSEIMTSFYELFAYDHPQNGLATGVSHPLSALSVAFLEDLGYSVNYTNSQAFSLGEGNENLRSDREGE